jgi:hypothetical protein
MFMDKYGPFATTIAIAAALVAVFSLLLLKSVGRVSQWTWLVHNSPSFMVTAGARAVAVALIAVSFILIDKSNYVWFAVAAVLFGIIAFFLIGWFDLLRKRHTCKVPILNASGSQATSFWGTPRFELLVIGDQSNMNATAAAAYKKAGPVSLCQFMSGFGSHAVNQPAAIWNMAILAKISNRMTMALMGILLCAVMALYLAASAIEVQQRPVASTQTHQ